MEVTKQRTTLMLSILRGIRYIKLFAWEKSFAADANRIRWRETSKVRGIHFSNTSNHAFEQCQQALVVLLSTALRCRNESKDFANPTNSVCYV